jgi:Thiamine pyrophosphate enzyme, C-terminal TPP binding domain
VRSAAPDKFCVHFMGDAAFGMTGLDVETAARERLAVAWVVLNNSTMAVEIPKLVESHERYRTRDIAAITRRSRARSASRLDITPADGTPEDARRRGLVRDRLYGLPPRPN